MSKRILNFSKFYIAGAASILYLSNYLLILKVYPYWGDVLWVFFATFLAYNFSYILSNLNIYRKGEIAFLSKLVFIILSLLVSIYVVIFIPQYILFLLPVAIITFLYNIPHSMWKLPLSHIRKIPLVKVFLIAYVWTAVTVVMPTLTLNSISNNEIMLFIALFCFMIGITLPFDIRDVEVDKLKGILTFPLLIGVKNTKLFSLLVFLFFILFSYSSGYNSAFYASLLTSFVGVPLVFYSREKRAITFYGILVDGLIYWYSGCLLFFIFS